MNRLQHETSPYLLQHANNPVDWYPWGEEAFADAQAQDRPVLLSIGYSSCHWCHVMAHESFEDPETAAFMNEHYINIKVDREERPDVDDIYMQATLIFTGGHGGWPMTAFLTPDGRPFHAGTYFPPLPRHGMPSFRQVLMAALDAYQNRRDQLEDAANRVTQSLQNMGMGGEVSEHDTLHAELLAEAARKLTARPDRIYGGLHGGQPKFPSPMNLEFLLRYYTTSGNENVLDIVTFTLKKMARGGVYDQIGGGFHRYSVDQKWLVPHFEKMLYDNAQLARVYLHAYQITNDPFFADITRDILRYVDREMIDHTLDDGIGFYSTQDADSEGIEGKFFIWTPAQIREVLSVELSEEAITLVFEYWGITDAGNFEGKNIPNVEDDLADVAEWHDLSLDEATTLIAQARQLLFEAREERTKPGRDEKMLSAWNGMILAAFAETARVMDDEQYRQIAEQNATFLRNKLSPDGLRLYRTYKSTDDGGEAKLDGYLEDYANVIDGFLELYQTTFEAQCFETARDMADYVLEHFRSENGGFYDTSDEHESLIARPRSVQDNATPSGNNLMAYNLIRLAAYTGHQIYEEVALEILSGLSSAMREYPSAFGVALSAAYLYVHRPVEVAVVGDPATDGAQALLDVVQKPFRPRVITALATQDQGEDSQPPLLAYRTRKNNRPTVYVCQNFVCQMPVTSAQEVDALLSEQN